MSVYVVGEPPLVEAFELIGVPGQVPSPGQDVAALASDLARSGRVQLLLVQSELAAALSEEAIDRLSRRFGCLVLEVPGVGEVEAPEASAFLHGVRSAVGAVR